MNNHHRFLFITQDIIFILLSIFYCIFGNTFFRSQEAINTFFVNNLINIVIGLFFIGCQFIITAPKVIQNINTASGLFIAYNFILILILQKSMFGVFILLEFALVIYLSIDQIKTKILILRYSTKERLFYGLILIFFSSIFIARGIKLIITYFQTSSISNEIAVGISDVIICSMWLVSAILLLFNNQIGIKVLYSVIIQASLLFITLTIHMIIYPIMYHEVIDIFGLVIIIVMSLFFIIPLLIISKKKLTTAST